MTTRVSRDGDSWLTRPWDERDAAVMAAIPEPIRAMFLWTVADEFGFDVGSAPPRSLDEMDQRIAAVREAAGAGPTR